MRWGSTKEGREFLLPPWLAALILAALATIAAVRRNVREFPREETTTGSGETPPR